MNTQRLRKEIEQQTRNGRTEVYMSIADLQELQPGLWKSNIGNRIFVQVDYVEELIDNYEMEHKNSFKESLKVNYTPSIKETNIEDKVSPTMEVKVADNKER